MKDELTAWRHDFHMHPELSFEETRTSGLVAERLRSWGIEVATGIAKTGVVGTLRGKHPIPEGKKVPSIGLRADMDALEMMEETNAPHKSLTPGKFHGCGHDGHTTMLLGAAKHLAASREFCGDVHFIFQPAEEVYGGGRVMVEDEKLFDKFPCDTVYGIHNWPLLPEGVISARVGPIMASNDEFTITVKGHGGHAAMPHLTTDPIVISAQVVSALQGMVSRHTDPLDSAVVSVTQFRAGTDAYNVIPDTAQLGGTLRSFQPETRERLISQLKATVQGVVTSLGGTAEVNILEGYPATINHKEQADLAAAVAATIVGEDNVVRDATPTMGAEDFSFMLNQRPGCYIWLGSGSGGGNPCMVHDPKYDFNDNISPIGASWFVKMVETSLPPLA